MKGKYDEEGYCKRCGESYPCSCEKEDNDLIEEKEVIEDEN